MGFSHLGVGALMVPHYGGGVPAPVADFSADDTTPAVDQVVTFTDLSTNTPTSWSWDFGDGGTSTDQNPTHTYTELGTFTVALTATNAAGDDTETKVGYIVVTTYTLNFTGLVAFPAGWTAPNWTVSANTAKNTPTQGSELVTNGNMETGNPPSSWNAGPNTALTGQADERTGGSGVQSLQVANSGGGNAVASQTVATVAGEVYRVSDWKKCVTAARLRTTLGNGGFGRSDVTETSWTNRPFTVRASQANANLNIQNIDAIDGVTARADDESVKALTLLLSYRDLAAANIIVKGAWTISGLYQAGVIARMSSNGANYLVAYYNNAIGTCELIKRVGATVTQLISVTTAYSAGANVEIRTNGSTVQLFYNNIQIGTDQTVSDVEVTNTIHGLFSTDVSSTCASFSVEAS